MLLNSNSKWVCFGTAALVMDSTAPVRRAPHLTCELTVSHHHSGQCRWSPAPETWATRAGFPGSLKAEVLPAQGPANLPPLSQKNLTLDSLWISVNPSPKLWHCSFQKWPFCSSPAMARGAPLFWGQSLTHGWTSWDPTMSTPALCSQESPALLLSHTKKSQYDQQFPQLSLRKVSTAHLHFTTISAFHSKPSVHFFHLAFSHWNSEEFISL